MCSNISQNSLNGRCCYHIITTPSSPGTRCQVMGLPSRCLKWYRHFSFVQYCHNLRSHLTPFSFVQRWNHYLSNITILFARLILGDGTSATRWFELLLQNRSPKDMTKEFLRLKTYNMVINAYSQQGALYLHQWTEKCVCVGVPVCLHLCALCVYLCMVCVCVGVSVCVNVNVYVYGVSVYVWVCVWCVGICIRCVCICVCCICVCVCCVYISAYAVSVSVYGMCVWYLCIRVCCV